MVQKIPGVDVNGMAARRQDYRHSGLIDLRSQILDLLNSIRQVVQFGHFGQSLSHALEVATRQTSVRREALG